MSTWIDNFNFEPLIINNKEYIIKPKDILKFESEGNYWHAKKDPSTWLIQTISGFIKQKYKAKSKAVQNEITAHLLGITVKSLDSGLDWNDKYMDWHG